MRYHIVLQKAFAKLLMTKEQLFPCTCEK